MRLRPGAALGPNGAAAAVIHHQLPIKVVLMTRATRGKLFAARKAELWWPFESGPVFEGCGSRHLSQRETKCSAFPDLCLGPDAATMTRNDPLHSGQADAGALKVGVSVQQLKWRKKFAGVGHIKSCAVIPNEKYSFVSLHLLTSYDQPQRGSNQIGLGNGFIVIPEPRKASLR
jgi:hypothetical protein